MVLTELNCYWNEETGTSIDGINGTTGVKGDTGTNIDGINGTTGVEILDQMVLTEQLFLEKGDTGINGIDGYKQLLLEQKEILEQMVLTVQMVLLEQKKGYRSKKMVLLTV
jgi:hypothetical protein